MELDDLKQAWATHGAMLERSLMINERLLRDATLRKVRVAHVPHVVWRGFELAFGIFMLLAVVPVLVRHLDEPRYLILVGSLAVFVIAMTVMCGHLLLASLRVDYSGPVSAIQRDISRLQVAEYRAFKWALLGGVVIWLPAVLVLFEAWTGIDAIARADLGWLVGNVVLGIGVLAVGMRWSRKHVERAGHSRLIDALSGRSLRVMRGHLADLETFERETTG